MTIQNIPQNTVYYILKEYLRYGTTKDLRNGRPQIIHDLNNLLNLSTIEINVN